MSSPSPSGPHLLAYVSGHGYGHLGMTAPVLNALRRRIPALRLTVRTPIPTEILARRIDGEFGHQQVADDFGMVQRNALEVDREASCASYRAVHADWPGRLDAVRRDIERVAPDLVLSNVGYLTLAAAHDLSIPAFGYSCLNWYEIYRHFCDDEAVASQILAAYQRGNGFIQPTPTMPMASLDNRLPVGPVAETGSNRRAELIERLGLEEGVRLVLVGMGGIAHRLPVEDWPVRSDLRWVVEDSWAVRHPGAVTVGQTGLGFRDLMASVDLMIGKPGYGTVAEVAATALPFLFVERPDWPEQPYLVEWLRENSRCVSVAESALRDGSFVRSLDDLLGAGRLAPILPMGIMQTVELLNPYLV